MTEKHAQELLEAGSVTAIEKVREVLIAVQSGKRLTKDDGVEALTLFNWLFGYPPYERDSVLLKVQLRRIAEEREACAKVADDRAAEIKDLMQNYEPDTYIYNQSVSELDECELLAGRIRARS